VVLVVIGMCKGLWFVCSDDWWEWLFDGLYLLMMEVLLVDDINIFVVMMLMVCGVLFDSYLVNFGMFGMYGIVVDVWFFVVLFDGVFVVNVV